MAHPPLCPCVACGHAFYSTAKPPPARCPQCRAAALQQRLCLGCGASFPSDDAGLRVCNTCRPAWVAALARYDERWWGWSPQWSHEDGEGQEEE